MEEGRNIRAKLNFTLAIEIIAILIALAAVITSINGNRISNQNLALAKQAFEDARIESVKKDQENRERFKMDSANSQAQIEALKGQVGLLKKQFEIENRPFLIVQGIDSIQFEPNKIPIVTFKYINYGRYPTRIIKSRTNFFFAETKFISDEEAISSFKKRIQNSKWINTEDNRYIYNSSVWFADIFDNRIVTEQEFKNVTDNGLFLYWGKEIIFEDVIKRENHRTIFLCKIFAKSKHNVMLYHSEY